MMINTAYKTPLIVSIVLWTVRAQWFISQQKNLRPIVREERVMDLGVSEESRKNFNIKFVDKRCSDITGQV